MIRAGGKSVARKWSTATPKSSPAKYTRSTGRTKVGRQHSHRRDSDRLDVDKQKHRFQSLDLGQSVASGGRSITKFAHGFPFSAGQSRIIRLSGVSFIEQNMNTDMIAAYPESERAIIVGRPMWATVAFFVFVASLLGVIVTMTHTLRLFGPSIEFSPAEMAGIILMPLVLAAFLVWYSKFAENRTWIS